MTDCMSSTFLLPREKVPSCEKKNVSYLVQIVNGLVWFLSCCLLACLSIRSFCLVVQHGLCRDARRRIGVVSGRREIGITMAVVEMHRKQSSSNGPV